MDPVDLVTGRVTAVLLLVAASCLLMPSATASPCSEAVQGVIAWDGRADTRWEVNNLDLLCRGAEQSLEPTRCFRAIMSGRINWGGGTRWNPRNALNLCRASIDARATIRCFMDRIEQQDHWREAIAACQAPIATTSVSAAQMPETDDDKLPGGHSFGIRDGEFDFGGDSIYRIGCSNCQALYCAPGDEIVSHGGSCEFGALARNYIEKTFTGSCAGIGCWTVHLSCRGAQLKPLSVIESRSSIQARCLESR